MATNRFQRKSWRTNARVFRSTDTQRGLMTEQVPAAVHAWTALVKRWGNTPVDAIHIPVALEADRHALPEPLEGDGMLFRAHLPAVGTRAEDRDAEQMDPLPR